jgi:DNA-directed RNA polymerase specialized sigma24 family protein
VTDQRTHIEQIAADVCTDKELAAFILWHRGAGYRRIGNLLGISWETARDRVHRARRKIATDPRLKELAS